MRSTRHKFKLLRGIGTSKSSSSTSATSTIPTNSVASSGVGAYRKHHQQQVHYHNFPRHSHSSSSDNLCNRNTKSESGKGEEGEQENSFSRFEQLQQRHHHRSKPYNQSPTSHFQTSSSHLPLKKDHNPLSENIQSLSWTEIHSSTTSTMDCELMNSDIRAKAFAICKDYLNGVWKQITAKDLIVKRISGGLSNYLYHCSLPSSLSPIYTEPTQVLLRFYGQVHGEGALESLITESVIFTLLSERKLGPRLFGVFPGGRVEEFIPARPLQTVELRDEELTLLIAQKMAQIHALNIPISKEPSWLWGTMDRWMTNVEDCLLKSSVKEDCSKSQIIKRLKKFNLKEEIRWLRKYLPMLDSPVVFSHNDMQEGNILIRPEFETMDDKLALIDFEYCSYNYRGFDLANHFCEWSYNYNIDLYPNFAYSPTGFPSQQEKEYALCRLETYFEHKARIPFSS